MVEGSPDPAARRAGSPIADFIDANGRRIEEAFEIGLSRAAALLPDPPAVPDPLALAALLAQRRRYDRPPPCRRVDAPRRLPADSRPVLPETARRPLRWLAENCVKGAGTRLTLAAIGRVLASPFRLHPYDLPLLALFLKRCGEEGLGPTERAFLRIAGGSEGGTDPFLSDRSPTAEDWASFPHPARLEFIHQLRRTDADSARDLIRSCFAAEPAPFRAELLRTLSIGLGPGDRPLLDEAAAGRVASVRDAALDVLGALPGTEQHAARVARVAAIFAIRNEGLLKRRKCLVLAEMPAKPPSLSALPQSLASIGIAAVAERLGVSEQDALRPGDQADLATLTALLLLALNEDRTAEAVALAEALGERGAIAALPALKDALMKVPPSSRLPLVRALRLAEPDCAFPVAQSWHDIGRLFGGAIPDSIADGVMTGKGWSAYLADLAGTPSRRRYTVDEDIAAFASVLSAESVRNLIVEAISEAKILGPIGMFADMLEALAASIRGFAAGNTFDPTD